jgi:hypothetical protein
MEEKKEFFLREPWKFDPNFKTPARPVDSLGFDTKALHAGFRPDENLDLSV